MNRSEVVKSARYWSAEMERATEAVAEAGAHVEIIDGNRAIADTLRHCADLLDVDALAAEPEAAGSPNDVAIRELEDLRRRWMADGDVVAFDVLNERIAALRGAGKP